MLQVLLNRIARVAMGVEDSRVAFPEAVADLQEAVATVRISPLNKSRPSRHEERKVVDLTAYLLL